MVDYEIDKDKLTIDDIKSKFILDREVWDLSLREFEIGRKYYHGDQLEPEVLNILKSRGQPPLIENIFKATLNKILGYKINSEVELKVMPMQEADKPLATLLNDLLVVFKDSDNYDKEMLKRDFNLIFGVACVELWVKEDASGNRIITMESLNPTNFIIDSDSEDGNANDAYFFHKITYMGPSRSPFDRSRYTGVNKVQVIETWYKRYEGLKEVWDRYIWNENEDGFIYEKAPLLDGGCPFIFSKFYIDQENRWYGLFRDLKPLQDYINFAENRVANMMGSMKAFFEEDAVLDVEQFIRDASIDNAIVKVRPDALRQGKLHFVSNNGNVSGLSQKTNEKRFLFHQIAGLNNELLGLGGDRQSSSSIASRQQAGLMGLQNFLKLSDAMDRLIYKRALSLIQHYFTKEQVYRIVDPRVGERYFAINTKGDNIIKIGRFDLVYRTELKVNKDDDRVSQWNEIIRTIGSVNPQILPDLLPLMLRDTHSSVSDDVRELIDNLQNERAMHAQSNQPLQDLQLQLSIEKAKAEIEEIKAKAQKYHAQSELAKEGKTIEGDKVVSRDMLKQIREDKV